MRGRYGTQRQRFFQREITKMTRSWAYGAATVLAVHILWIALILTQAHADWMMGAIIVMLFVTMNIAGLGAFITAFLAPRQRFLLGLSMAPLAALLAAAGNLLLAASGTHVNFSGFRGNAGLFAVSLAYGMFVSAVGGGIGTWLARRRATGRAPPLDAMPASPQVAADSPITESPPAPPSHI
jgi:hypothetical protein